MGGGLGGEGLVRQLRLDALEVALGLGLLLGDALPLLLEVHQLRERQKDPCGVGDEARIGQLVITPVVIADFVTDLGAQRGTGGFGSTGT